MFFNFENKVWQWRIGGWGTLGTVLHIFSLFKFKFKDTSGFQNISALWTKCSQKFSLRSELGKCHVSTHIRRLFFLAITLFLPSIAFDLPLPNFWITISAISITIDRGLIS